ncbi:PilZ domain-containing protein [Methylomonas sp. AM2-LC]|uniref:PilZ domain-containing protein n=1 Tax=Methylomonas sp. AM2-LC TaxID=3153301 RepID=UPI0032664A21
MADEIEEKRRYFRVNDTINLHHKLIDEHVLDKLSHVSNDVLSNCTLNTALDVLTQDSRALFTRLERRDSEIAEYLKIMDTKINLLAQAISVQSQQFFEHDTREVVLSATGLAFSNETEIKPGQLLELRMLLTSCMAVIVAFARVVQCKNIVQENPSQPFAICVEYINLQEDDRELLIKHVVKKQLQQLRDKYDQ